MASRIMVIGGYGHVGKQICTHLSKMYPGQVFAAGRNRQKAEQFSLKMKGAVQPFQIDVMRPKHWDWLKETRLVIMCLDQEETTFAERCLRAGVDYIDISAKGTYLKKLASIKREAVKATAILSVGLAPGMTNLLAAKAASALDKVEEIDISVMLGIGDQHGRAAVEWTIDHLHYAYTLVENHQSKKVDSLTGGKRVNFGGSLGSRRVYRFPFSDQQTLPTTLQVPTVTTRLCLDSRASTFLLVWARRLGLTKLFDIPFIYEKAISSIQSSRMGTDQYALKIDAVGWKGQQQSKIELGLVGRDESQATANIAAAVAAHLYSKRFSKGIYHIEQAFELGQTGETLMLIEKETKRSQVIAGSVNMKLTKKSRLKG
ncbi:saccharopine dehydrogenase family protein [Bacillus sp. NPDC077027]|uniref:saccharopine dehydrogenase family protein n=1 Tax=Bacillus sp. NPDC077027 TaxID=3390548 RepID=UPI003D00997A